MDDVVDHVLVGELQEPVEGAAAGVLQRGEVQLGAGEFIHCTRDMLEAIELGRPSVPTDRVIFRGLDLFAVPARELVRRMGEYTSIEADPDDPASFVASDLLLSFWRPFAADDEPEEEQGYCFRSVLLARRGYYDTPVQAAERFQQSS